MTKDSFPAFFVACPSKKYLGLDCPGCGMQRAYYSLYKGKPIESVRYNPGALPFILLIIFTLFHLRFKFRHGHLIILWGFIATATAMWGNFIYKLFIR